MPQTCLAPVQDEAHLCNSSQQPCTPEEHIVGLYGATKSCLELCQLTIRPCPRQGIGSTHLTALPPAALGSSPQPHGWSVPALPVQPQCLVQL